MMSFKLQIYHALEIRTSSKSRHVRFSPDGQKLASVSDNNRLWLWDIETGITELANVPFISAGHVAFAALISHDMDWSFDEQGFLRHELTRLLWLPTSLRGRIAVHKSFVAIGAPSGAITFIQWPVTL
jgi:hypothetical protein